MTYPEYDTATLPYIKVPFTNENEYTTKYLGGRALVRNQYATISVIATTDAEILALYDFWETDCNYGLTPFLVGVPFNGSTVVENMPSVVLKFIDKIQYSKDGSQWNGNIRCKVVGKVDYITDDLGALITDDSGDYIYADATTNSNTEITYV